MEKKIAKEKVQAIFVTLLIVGLLTTTLVLDNSRKSFSKGWDNEKITSEKLLSEKLQLDKEIMNMRDDMAQLEGKDKTLDKLLNETTKKLAAKEAELNKSYAAKNKAVSLQKELSEIKLLKEQLDNRIVLLTKENEQLRITLAEVRNENDVLNKSLASLQLENSDLTENIKILQYLVADNYMIESVKGKNDKMTVNAKRTKKLTVSFDIPKNVEPDLSFKIIDPNGRIIESKNNTSISVLSVEQEPLTATTAQFDGRALKINKHIEMVYEPTDKLTSGIYKIEIFNKETSLGTCNIRLK